MGQRKTIVSCVASLGLFALGATLGAHRTRRRERRARLAAASCDGSSTTSLTTISPPSSSDITGHASSSNMISEHENTNGALDCPVCLTEVILPRVVGCGHTICTHCLAALAAHERRPGCPVCRRRIRVAVDKLPVNFMVKAVVDARAAARGEQAVMALRQAEEEAMAALGPFASGGEGGMVGMAGRNGIVASLRPAWNWFKWTVIIVTEFGAFLVSLKEVLESAPTRSRRYQRIV